MAAQQIELLAPAGSPEALDAAVAEGADAVYLGLREFNARMRSANFAYAQFEAALKSLHRMGRKVYVTVNTVFEQRESDRVYRLLKYLAETGPDGVIVQDFGIVKMARDFPGLRLHASTQMNIASARGANALSKHGVSRVVLSRELTLEEIRGIRRGTNLELETFVHGALCISESGLCLFSSYLGGKSANRGMCTQACRRFYRAGSDLQETGGYFFSPCDLSLIGRTGDLAEAGVRSFKIEGRMKSAEYVGTVVSAYRLVIDSLESGEDERHRALEKA
ncbi:MAG: U32 family peptidase, partial [Treponema sp.]|nr:U32 family peptidase [Treponema sp.]